MYVFMFYLSCLFIGVEPTFTYDLHLPILRCNKYCYIPNIELYVLNAKTLEHYQGIYKSPNIFCI